MPNSNASEQAAPSLGTMPPAEGDIAVALDKAGKVFCSDLLLSMRYALHDLMNPFRGFSRPAALRPAEFYALRDVSFSCGRGETIGVLGSYRSGKSTLAGLIGGLYPPDEGKVRVNGSRALINSTGSGFRPMLTVRENVAFRLVLLGAPRSGLDDRCRRVLDFAGLTGKERAALYNLEPHLLRQLGLSIALHLDAEILVFDEVGFRGAEDFRDRALARLYELAGMRTLILITRNRDLLFEMAARAVALDDGRVIAAGPVKETVLAFDDITERRRAGAMFDGQDAAPPEGGNVGPEEDDAESDERDPHTDSGGREDVESADVWRPLLRRIVVDGEAYHRSRYAVLRAPGETLDVEVEFEPVTPLHLDKIRIGIHAPLLAQPIAARTFAVSGLLGEPGAALRTSPGQPFSLRFALVIPELQKGRYGVSVTLFAGYGRDPAGGALYKVLVFGLLTDAEPGAAALMNARLLAIDEMRAPGGPEDGGGAAASAGVRSSDPGESGFLPRSERRALDHVPALPPGRPGSLEAGGTSTAAAALQTKRNTDRG